MRLLRLSVAVLFLLSLAPAASAQQDETEPGGYIYAPPAIPNELLPPPINTPRPDPSEFSEDIKADIERALADGATQIDPWTFSFDDGLMIWVVYGNANDCKAGYFCFFEDINFNRAAPNEVCNYRGTYNWQNLRSPDLASKPLGCWRTASSASNLRNDHSFLHDSNWSNGTPHTICVKRGTSVADFRPWNFNDRADYVNNEFGNDCYLELAPPYAT